MDPYSNLTLNAVVTTDDCPFRVEDYHKMKEEIRVLKLERKCLDLLFEVKQKQIDWLTDQNTRLFEAIKTKGSHKCWNRIRRS